MKNDASKVGGETCNQTSENIMIQLMKSRSIMGENEKMNSENAVVEIQYPLDNCYAQHACLFMSS